MYTAEAPMPIMLLAVRVAWKLPAWVGMPAIEPLVLLKDNPGGRPLAVKPSGVLAPVTVKLNGWPTNATVDRGLVMTAGALDMPFPVLALFVEYKLVLGMISSD